MQGTLQIQPIFSIQLHIHCSHLFTFHNTFYIETLKRYARGITLTLIEHEHPLHAVSELPFAIVNATHIVARPRLMSLLESVATERPIRALFLKPIVQLCEEISAVGRIVSEEPNNPYFVLLSPVKKCEVYKWNNRFRQSIFECTQYFNPYTEQLNKQHFLYKLDCLATYLARIEKSKIVILCVYAMMKSLKIDNKMLYETVAKNELFRKCEEEGLGIAREQVGAEVSEPRFLATVIEDKEKKDNGGKVPTSNIFMDARLEFASRLAMPLIAFAIFWKITGGQMGA